MPRAVQAAPVSLFGNQLSLDVPKGLKLIRSTHEWAGFSNPEKTRTLSIELTPTKRNFQGTIAHYQAAIKEKAKLVSSNYTSIDSKRFCVFEVAHKAGTGNPQREFLYVTVHRGRRVVLQYNAIESEFKAYSHDILTSSRSLKLKIAH